MSRLKLYNICRSIRHFSSVLVILLIISFAVHAAAENDQKVVDNAGLLSEGEAGQLQERLTEIAEKYQCDVVVATSESRGNQSVQDYTDDFYYENGYGYGSDIDGIILMICMREREFHLATRGAAIRIFTDYGLEEIDERITGYLSDAEYAKAFNKFADLAEAFLAKAENGEPYDVGHTYREPVPVWIRILISFGAGLIVTAGVMFVLFRQLRSAAPKHTAREYVREGSFRVTRERDVFLYHTLVRRKIEQQNQSGHGGHGGSHTHSTSGGGRAGGRSGKF